MKYLYMDNYRGFQDTFVPISDVNFLVGENSTGKTSLLYLTHLLSTPRFWFEQTFNDTEVQLGTYGDIVSVGSNKKDDFVIGFIEERKNSISAVMINFIEFEGQPIVNRFYRFIDTNELKLTIKDDATYYSLNSLEVKSFESFKKYFYLWKNESSIKNYKLIEVKFPFPHRKAFLFLTTLILNKIDKPDDKNSLKHELPFELPVFSQDLAWIAPIRSKPKRTYDELKFDFSPEGEHTPYLIRKILANKTGNAKFLNYITTYGNNSGLFDSIDIIEFGNKAQPSSPFSLNIKVKDAILNILNVGYGISQILPVIVELFYRSENCMFAIQQPEVHLHPKAQAALGNTIFSLSNIEKKKFLIETHSDYLINRFRLNVRDNKSKIKSQVLYFEKNGNFNTVFPIEIDCDGEYSTDQPESFREFFIKEELDILGLK